MLQIKQVMAVSHNSIYIVVNRNVKKAFNFKIFQNIFNY